jgi:hypothetical protein
LNVIDRELTPFTKEKFRDVETSVPTRTLGMLGNDGAVCSSTSSKTSDSVTLSPRLIVSRSSFAVKLGSARTQSMLRPTTSAARKRRTHFQNAWPDDHFPHVRIIHRVSPEHKTTASFDLFSGAPGLARLLLMVEPLRDLTNIVIAA